MTPYPMVESVYVASRRMGKVRSGHYYLHYIRNLDWHAKKHKELDNEISKKFAKNAPNTGADEKGWREGG